MGSENMVVKVAIDNNIFGYLPEKSERGEYARLFFKFACVNPHIKVIVPLGVSIELAKAPKSVRKEARKYKNCVVWSVNKKVLNKAKKIDIPKSLIDKGIKKDDLYITIESSLLGCQYLITYNRKHLINHRNLIEKEFKRINLPLPNLLMPNEFLKLFYIPK
jgi:hypothetical protein